MAELCIWPEAARLLLTLLLSVCVAAQVLALVLSHYRHPRSPARVAETLLELSVLVQVFVCTLLPGRMLLGFELGLLAPSGLTLPRYAVLVASALLAAAVMAALRRPWPLLVIVASGLTLPVVERLCGSAFMYVFLAAMLFWLLRSVHICMLRGRDMRTSLSALSIKNAIDALPSGVLFGETDGFILLANRQMQRLMVGITGRVQRSGWAFYRQLLAGELQPGCHTAELEGQLVCLLPDASAWMFTKTELSIKGRAYIQLTAADVTRRWNLTARLRRQEGLLTQRSAELKDAIANVQLLSRQRETQRARMRAHDVLGQRLTLLLRTLRSEEAPGHEVLHALAGGLLEDLKAGPGAPSPQDELGSLQQAFAAIGVTIGVSGALPGGEGRGRLFVDIIRESATNAVRHGFATEIAVRMEPAGGGHRLVVANNGHPPGGPVAEGGGIGGMREKLAPYGGVLGLATHPQFVVTVDLPGGEADG